MDAHRMTDQRKVRVSKYLARHLRHDPGRIGITLDANGWVAVDDLLAAARRNRFALTRAELAEVVADPADGKRRFALSPDGTRIRAGQGHTVPVDLALPPLAPPSQLYHGTVPAALPAIRAEGLRPMARHHVHLSPDRDTAVRGQVLTVAAGAMHAAGHVFFRSDNGVWLTDAVPPAYLWFPGAH
jgi:putative RNA 2'-phosphotransferase